MPELVENVWNPVSLKNDKGGYTISNYAVSSSWYNRIIDNSGTRYTRLMRYAEADCGSVEIGRALDVLAEDISSCNADNEDVFLIEYEDDSKIKKTQIKLLNSALGLWEDRTGMKKDLFNHVRSALKYGMRAFRKCKDGSLMLMPAERFVGYVLSETNEDVVTHYLYDPNIQRIDRRGASTYNNYSKTNAGTGSKDYEIIPVDELVVMKVGDGPFGESVIEKVYKTYRQLSLLEDSVVIYRVVRAPERRLYYIDVGNLQGPKRERAIEQQRLRLMQKRVSKSGQIETDYDPHSTGEDIFIPTNSTGKGSRVETLPAGSNLGELSDLEWFYKKLAAGLRIPSSMIDTQSQERDQFSDMRVGQMYQIEMRYMGHVKRIKNQMTYPLVENFVEFCRERGVSIPEGFTFRINDSQSFATYKEIEINQTLLNVFNSTLQINQLSKKYALQKYLNMDMEEIRDNEINKLRERGVDDEQIKKMPEHVIDNIVYGDGRLGSEYGIEPQEQGRW